MSACTLNMKSPERSCERLSACRTFKGVSAQPSEALIAWKRRHVRLPPILEALSAARRGHRGVQHARHRGGHARIPAAAVLFRENVRTTWPHILPLVPNQPFLQADRTDENSPATAMTFHRYPPPFLATASQSARRTTWTLASQGHRRRRRQNAPPLQAHRGTRPRCACRQRAHRVA